MGKFHRFLPDAVRRFVHDERGIISAEAIIMTPLLIWTFLALFVYWDAFRAETATVRATYTITDMISRENAPINNAFVNGMHQVYRYMVSTPRETRMRVSSVRYNLAGDNFTVLWSRTTSAAKSPLHTNTTFNAMNARIPRPANADTLIVVETWREYVPAMKVGVGEGTFYEIGVARPRFLSPLPIS